MGVFRGCLAGVSRWVFGGGFTSSRHASDVQHTGHLITGGRCTVTFLMNTYIALFYALHVVLGSAINPYIAEYQYWITSSRFERTLNHMAISPYGYVLFTLVYLGYASSISNQTTAKKCLFVYGLHTLALCVLVMWFVGPLAFDRFNRFTGGHCEVEGISQWSCMQSDHWVNGFDTSGHTYMAVLMSFLVMDIFAESHESSNHGAQRTGTGAGAGARRVDEEMGVGLLSQTATDAVPRKMEWVRTMAANLVNARTDILDYVMYVLVAIWYAMLVVTALFFHTFWEKVVGLAAVLSVFYGVKAAANHVYRV